MDSRVFDTDKVLLAVLTFAVAMFFELHVAIWWVSRSESLGDLALLLAMGLLTVVAFSALTWYIVKTILLYQVGKQTVRDRSVDSKSEAESEGRFSWWKTVLIWYIVAMAGLVSIGLLIAVLI